MPHHDARAQMDHPSSSAGTQHPQILDTEACRTASSQRFGRILGGWATACNSADHKEFCRGLSFATQTEMMPKISTAGPPHCRLCGRSYRPLLWPQAQEGSAGSMQRDLFIAFVDSCLSIKTDHILNGQNLTLGVVPIINESSSISHSSSSSPDTRAGSMLSPGLILPTPDNSDMLSGAPSHQGMLCSPTLIVSKPTTMLL